MNVRACVYGFFVVILCAERDRGDRLKNIKFELLQEL